MSKKTEIGLMKRVLDLFKAPYIEARNTHGAPIKVRHDELLLLLEPGKACRAVDLARSCNVTPSAISHVLKELVWSGLVERKPGPDLRSISIEMTPQGLKTRTAVQRCVEQVNEEVLSLLDPDERDALHRILTKLVTRLAGE